jgi:hypothetical protein
LRGGANVAAIDRIKAPSVWEEGMQPSTFCRRFSLMALFAHGAFRSWRFSLMALFRSQESTTSVRQHA